MIDEWATSDFTVTPTRRCGGIGFFEAGNDGLNNQWSIKSTNIFNNHQIKYGFTYEDVEFAQVNDRTGPSFVAPDGRSTATGATLEIRSTLCSARSIG